MDKIEERKDGEPYVYIWQQSLRRRDINNDDGSFITQTVTVNTNISDTENT